MAFQLSSLFYLSILPFFGTRVQLVLYRPRNATAFLEKRGTITEDEFTKVVRVLDWVKNILVTL